MGCLKKIEGDDIPSILGKLNPVSSQWYPSIDNDLIPDNPGNLYRQKKIHNVDLMVGFNTDEGYMSTAYSNQNNKGIENREYFTKQIIFLLNAFYQKENAEELANEIVDFYLESDDQQNQDNLFMRLTDFIGDFMLKHPSIYTAHLHKKGIFNIF